MKLTSSGQYCLSQKGPAVGLENAATHSAISASSSADVAAHGANMAVDGSSNTFWVSVLRCVVIVIIIPVEQGRCIVIQNSKSVEPVWDTDNTTFFDETRVCATCPRYMTACARPLETRFSLVSGWV